MKAAHARLPAPVLALARLLRRGGRGTRRALGGRAGGPAAAVSVSRESPAAPPAPLLVRLPAETVGAEEAERWARGQTFPQIALEGWTRDGEVAWRRGSDA